MFHDDESAKLLKDRRLMKSYRVSKRYEQFSCKDKYSYKKGDFRNIGVTKMQYKINMESDDGVNFYEYKVGTAY